MPSRLFTMFPKYTTIFFGSIGISVNSWRIKDVTSLQHRANRRTFDNARRRKQNSAHILRCLLLCFPHGLVLMWKNSCTWRRSLKIAITCVYVALALTVVLYPAPGKEKSGSVEIVGLQREVEVFGPELPETMPESNYAYTATDSVVLTSNGNDDTVYVYASKGASCYHLFECKYAFASAQRLTVYEATFLGYAPCGLCHPPEYGQENAPAEGENP